MSLKCKNGRCLAQIVPIDQLAFRQDSVNGGWNLTLNSEFNFEANIIPNTIVITEISNNKNARSDANCKKCLAKLGVVNKICGFDDVTINFSSKKVSLFATNHERIPVNNGCKVKWSDVLSKVSRIPQIKATIKSPSCQLVGSDTIHFHGVEEFQQMLKAGNAVATRSFLTPKNSQWRSFFFACQNNTLLVLPTGFGKTFIAQMLMKAYHELNPNKIQVFVVPTIVLVEQQAQSIEKATGLKVQRRSGEHGDHAPWSQNEICTCTPAMFIQAMEFGEILMSQVGLLVLDEAHEANNTNSNYGKLIPKIQECLPTHRPRILAMTASPVGTNSPSIENSVQTLCNNLNVKPYIPETFCDEIGQEINCRYIEVRKSLLEIEYEAFVFSIIQKIRKINGFFAVNAQVHSNVPCAIKVDAAKRMISEAQNVSCQTNNNELLEIAMFCKKWIDSLDFLKIFGPRRLFDDIKKDLESPKFLESVIHLMGDILSFIKQETNRIYQYMDHSGNSEKMNCLMRELGKYIGTKTRVLIFVDKKFTAERLCRRLQDDEVTKQMNPDYVTGNSDGDFPKELQQEKLKKFKYGDIQVIIATSVLEQGIDVASCGAVIAFDGIKSLKSIIQSRGRARQEFSNFVVFVSPDKTLKVNTLSNLEQTMNLVVKNLMIKFDSKFDDRFEHEVVKFLSGNYDEQESLEKIEELSDVDEDSDDDDEEIDEENLISLSFFDFNNSKDLVEVLTTAASLYKKMRLKINKKRITANVAIHQDEDQVKKISTIIKAIASEAMKCDVTSWVKNLKMEFYESNHFDGQEVEFDHMTGFYFEDPTTILLDSQAIWQNSFQLVVEKSSITLKCGEEKFLIERHSLDSMIVINETEQILEMYLCLRRPPAYFVGIELRPYDFTQRSFNLCLTRCTPYDKMNSLIMALTTLSLDTYYIINPTKKCFNYQSTDVSGNFVKSYLIKQWHSANSEVLPPILPRGIVKNFEAIQSNQFLQMILANLTPTRFRKLKIPIIQENRQQEPFPETPMASNYVKIGRICLTPSRMIFKPMTEIPMNRVYRYFPNPENFLIVEFCNEIEGNPWQSKSLADHFLGIMENGFQINGKTFNFLGCSNSQLRESRCWFSCLNRAEVYQKIGDFSNFTNPGKKLTRLGLAFASSEETITLDEKYLKNVENDIVSGETCFSDGVGTASKNVFKRIAETLSLQVIPSAFQIRVGGVKGVISVYDQVEDVKFRKSMKKFESTHCQLEVLVKSMSIPLSLNRHVILMLSSFGVPDEVFLEMQQNDLQKCRNILTSTSETEIFNFIRSRSKVIELSSQIDTQIIREPFINQILHNQVISLIGDLVEHASISVEKGRILMGVLDETGTLEYGEIYANIEDINLKKTLDGQVIIFRNPCVLPSDVRLLRARSNVPENFKNLYKNVLVIPSKGPDSHANECAGGDLDGDLYYVIWDEKLIPPNLTSPGREVIKIYTEEYETDIGTEDIDLMKFYCNYQQFSRLGVIANAHLAASDQFGIESDEAVALAKFVVAETDAPKKGYTVGDKFREYIPTSYPHYMTRSSREKYQSQTIVGKLYNNAFTIIEIMMEKTATGVPKNYISSTTDESSIEYWYSLYCFEIKNLIESFEVSSEVDLFSGTPVWLRKGASDYKKKTQLKVHIEDAMKIFWQHWKKRFDDWRVKVGNKQTKIYEWYSRPKSHLWPASSFSFLAIPLLTFDTIQAETTVKNIQRSMMSWISFNKMNWAEEWSKRHSVGNMILEKLSSSHFYGSSMLGLSEEFSDIDLFTTGDLAGLPTILKTFDPNVHHLTKPNKSVKLTFDHCSIEITQFQPGVIKTYTIAEYFDSYPYLWPSFRVLLEWARIVRLVKSGESQGLMTVVAFCMMFIEMTVKTEIKLTEKTTPYSIARLRNWMEASNDEECGSIINNFLNVISDRRNRMYIASRRDPVSDENLIRPDLIDELLKLATSAGFILAAHNGDIRKLFTYSTKYRLFKINKKLLNSTTVTENLKTQAMSEIKKKSNLGKNSLAVMSFIEKSGFYYLEVESDVAQEFVKIEKALTKIHDKIANANYSFGRSSKAHHIENSTLVIPEYSRGPRTEVTFSIFRGTNFHAQHITNLRAVLDVRSNELNHHWKVSEYDKFKNVLCKQMRLYEKSLQKLDQYRGTHMWRLFGKMRCVIRTGDHYFFNVPDTLINTFESLELQRVEKIISAFELSCQVTQQKDMMHDAQRYRRLTLFESNQNANLIKVSSFDKNEPMKLMPMQEMINHHKKRKVEEKSVDVAARALKKVGGLRSSFYTGIKKSNDEIANFASSTGFSRDSSDKQFDGFVVTITVIWRSREISITTDNLGMITSIKHRKIRWLSATFKRHEKTAYDDVRAYLESKQILDEEENCLNILKQYLGDRSIFTKEFTAKINQLDITYDNLPTQSLIPEIFNLNWKFRSLRIIKNIQRFSNDMNDEIEHNEIFEGLFRSTHSVDWLEKRRELEIEMNMTSRNTEQLSRDSYVAALNLFDFTKN